MKIKVEKMGKFVTSTVDDNLTIEELIIEFECCLYKLGYRKPNED
jgi:hypothetical protein